MNYMAIIRVSAIGATTSFGSVITTQNFTIIDISELDGEMSIRLIV